MVFAAAIKGRDEADKLIFPLLPSSAYSYDSTIYIPINLGDPGGSEIQSTKETSIPVSFFNIVSI